MNIYPTMRKAARRWLLRTLQPCQAMVPVMSESLERRLGLIEQIKLRLHLVVCAWCGRYLKQIRLLRLAVRHARFDDTGGNPPLDKLTDEARRRFQNQFVYPCKELKLTATNRLDDGISSSGKQDNQLARSAQTRDEENGTNEFSEYQCVR